MMEVTMGDRVHNSPSVPLDMMDPSIARFWSDIGLTPPTDIPPLPTDSDAINDANRDNMAAILVTALSQIQSQVPPQVTPFQDLATAAVHKMCHKPFVNCLAKCGARWWLLLFKELWISSWSVFGMQAVKNLSTEEWNSNTLALYELYLLEDEDCRFEDVIITFIDKTTARTQIGDCVFMGEFQKNLMRHAFQHFRNRCFYATDQLLKGGPSHQGLIPPTITSHEGIIQFANICTMWDPAYGYMLFHELVPIMGSDKFQLICFRNRSFLDICRVAINAVDTSAFFGIFEKTTGADNHHRWGTLRYCPTHSLALITTWHPSSLLQLPGSGVLLKEKCRHFAQSIYDEIFWRFQASSRLPSQDREWQPPQPPRGSWAIIFTQFIALRKVPVVPEATSSQHITGRWCYANGHNIIQMSLPPLSLSYEEIVERLCQAIARVKDSMEEADADFEFYESEIVNIVTITLMYYLVIVWKLSRVPFVVIPFHDVHQMATQKSQLSPLSGSLSTWAIANGNPPKCGGLQRCWSWYPQPFSEGDLP
ncbi:hypothetical protein BDN67DRAFT_983206 [Paxillus ammoniavirescens]|nr:hypothetical protein BDN67DRAFT_983206 [Paxillus ammoniavirescens]